jgi:hypothetical protein
MTTNRLQKQIEEASRLKLELEELAAKDGGYASKLASFSMASHIDDLAQQSAIEASATRFEHVELRLVASKFSDGSAPLDLISRLSDNIMHIVGYAALRLIRGGSSKKRIPRRLYQDLDLRLLGLLPGSSRMVISANSNRDIFDDGIAKGSLERIFRLLVTNGEGDEFLQSVTDLGPQSSIWLRRLLDLIIGENSELEMLWRYRGDVIFNWRANQRILPRLSTALASTEVSVVDDVLIMGNVELLSKRERIHLLSNDGDRYKILYPKHLLSAVSELHLDQAVVLKCAVIETNNPLTEEKKISYELLKVVSQ